MKMLQTTVLLCIEDQSMRMVLAECMEKHGIEVLSVTTGFEAMEKTVVDCCVIDVAFDKHSGYGLIKELRAEGRNEPIIFLTDSNVRQDQIRAYELGADDVVVKPFSVDILLCKVHALVRRYKEVLLSPETVFDLGGKIFDSVKQVIGEHRLSGRENELLLMLCQGMNAPVDRHRILRTLWQKDDFFSTRSLAVYINRLRGVLEGTNCRIVSVHGKGYKLINF